MTLPTLLMTRERTASEHFVAGLDPAVRQSVSVIYAPLLDIVPNRSVAPLADYAGVIFTSANGVRFAPLGAGRLAYCVGARTAARARDAGWSVQVVEQDADALVTRLCADMPQAPLLHIAGAHRRGEIAQRLTSAGLPTQVHVAYDQPLLPLTEKAQAILFGEGIVIVPLFSPRVAAQFGAQAACGPSVHVLAISQAVADALGGSFAERLHIASAPSGEEMRRGLENLLRGNSSP